MELTRVKRERALDAVHSALREAILNGVLQPGERLDVAELAEKLDVSLTPVRDALQLLAAEGLVEIRPRSGTFVARLSARDVRETFDVRCALECLAAEQAIGRITRQHVQRMKELLKQMARPVRTAEDRRAHEASNCEFHMVLLEAAGNQRLRKLYESLHAHIQIARIHAADKHWPGRLEQERLEHRAILEAVKARDLAGLIEGLRRHIFRARDSLAAAVESRSAGVAE
ncbi:MAG: GntR family transcriptional regulator [Bryobacteraceae bacterium]